MKLDGDDREIGFADLDALASIATFDVREGDLSSVERARLAISSDTAEEKGWAIGRQLAVVFPDGASESLTVAAIYDERAMGGDVLLPDSSWAAHAAQPTYVTVLLGLADGVDLESGRGRWPASPSVTEGFRYGTGRSSWRRRPQRSTPSSA